MAFTFLHTADWQIGKTFGGFDADRASILKHARLTAIDRLAAAARGGGAGHVIVCGDVFDSPGLPERVLRETMAKLATHHDLVWCLLPGNHDPARADGVWQRLMHLGVPANVRLLLAAEPLAIAPGVVLLPAPLAAKAVSTDPTTWMTQAIVPSGAIRIGVAHGSTQGFGSLGLASVGIDPDRRTKASLDYLALGDWHGVREIEPGTWYSGTPEPDQFPDNEPGFALLVAIEGAGAQPRVQRVATAGNRWLKRDVTVSSEDDLAAFAAEIAALGADKGATLVEVSLRGTVSLAGDAAISARLADLEAGLFHLRVRREALTVDAGGDDIAALKDAQIERVAERLIAMRDAASTGDRIAEGALRRLFVLARKVQEQRA